MAMDQDSDNSNSNHKKDATASINGDGDKQILAPSEGPREHLITTALKFLQNPKVMSSPLYQKKAFLEKKGLTQEEINISVQRAGVTETAGSEVVQAARGPPPGYQPGLMNGALSVPQPAYVPIPPQSTWGKVRDLTMTTVVVASVSYTLYQLFQKYLRPLIFGMSEQERRMDRLETQIVNIQKAVSESMADLNKTLVGIQTSLQNQQPQIPAFPSNDRGVADLKQDIASLKGLLLNRNQFPAAPAIAPVLPAWQRAAPSPPAPESALSSSSSTLQNSASSVASSTDQTSMMKDETDSHTADQTIEDVPVDQKDDKNHNSVLNESHFSSDDKKKAQEPSTESKEINLSDNDLD